MKQKMGRPKRTISLSASIIGYRIKAVRTAAGLSQDSFASEISNSSSSIANWEHCRAEVPQDMIKKIAIAFKEEIRALNKTNLSAEKWLSAADFEKERLELAKGLFRSYRSDRSADENEKAFADEMTKYEFSYDELVAFARYGFMWVERFGDIGKYDEDLKAFSDCVTLLSIIRPFISTNVDYSKIADVGDYGHFLRKGIICLISIYCGNMTFGEMRKILESHFDEREA